MNGPLPRIGVRVPQYGAEWPTLLAFARRAEALGADSLWVNDHLLSPGRNPAEPAFDSLTTLAALAPLVPRVRLGVCVLSASYRPAAVAAKALTLIDVISGGRAVAGLGAGSHRAEHRALGIPFASPRERTAHALRALEAMRAMFRDPDGLGDGAPPAGAPNLPGPATPGGPPIWLAAHGPVLLRGAGRAADGIVAAFVEPGEIRRRLAVARGTREAGAPPLACALYTFALAMPSVGRTLEWLEPEARALGTEPRALLRWLRGTGVVGSPGEVRDALHAHRVAGATDAVLALPSRVPPEALEALMSATADRASPGAPARTPRRPDVTPEDNLADVLVGGRVRGGMGDRAAVIDDAGQWTYDELWDAAARAGGALGRAGVRRGDRVAVVLPDGRDWCAAFLGAARIGAVPVPLDPSAEPDALTGILSDCEPAAVVAAGAGPGDGWRVLDPGALADGAPGPIAPVHPADLGYLIYSSGSTGRPKAAMHAHADMRTGIETYAKRILGLGPGDRCHSVARLFTSLGFGNGFFRVLGRGATAVMSQAAPTPRSVLRLVEARGVSVLTGVPTFWSQLGRYLERHGAGGELGGVRLGISSGDSLPAGVAAGIAERAGVEVIEGLGCSECSNVVISQRPGEPLPGRLGRAVPGVDIRLADPDGRPVSPGEPGRLWIRSPSNTTGYWRRPDATRDLVHGPWLRMGDVLVEEDGGAYRHMGRADDLFKVDARWVSPAAVESVLLGHAAVEEAAVVGLAGDDGLMRAAAFVVPADGWVDDRRAGELRSLVARALGTHCAPRTVTAVARLPRLPSGKLDRRRLRGAGH